MHNKKTTILLFSVLIMTTLTTTVYADEALIITDNLNIRSGPSVQFEIIDQVQTDEVYPILQKQDEWVQIKLTDKAGWVATEYITLIKAEKKVAPVNKTGKTITVLHNNTHIRNGPSTKDDIISYAEEGTVFSVISEDEDWYKITNNELTGYIFKKLVDKKPVSINKLNNKVIAIDAGHGGRDVGSIGASGIYEKDLTYRTATELQQKLTMLGAEVILTRTSDEYVKLASRASLANIIDTDVFISIHYNSFPELPNITGIGTYYFHNQNKQLANTIQKEIIKETEAKDRKIAFGDFQVLRQNVKPAILVELGFISNDEKEQLLLTNSYQKKLVKGIITGLERYFIN